MGVDAYPSWTPDGAHVLYQAQDAGQPDRDRCLFLIPAQGGTAAPVACDDGLGSQDSTNVFGPAALSPSGKLIFYKSAEPTGFGVATTIGMYLAPFVPVATSDSALALPVVATSGARADKLISLRWLGDSGFLGLGIRTSLFTPYPCNSCKQNDTLETGVQVFWVDMQSTPPVVTPIPGTDRASSFSFVAPDTIYFTLNNDNRILRTRIAGGAVDSVFAFATDSNDAPAGFRSAVATIARGVQVTGHTAYAVLGGRVQYHPDSGSGEAQQDWGGKVHKINLTTGADTALSMAPPPVGLGYVWMRHLALSPDGSMLTGEGRPVLLQQIVGGTWLGTDTTISPTANIWEYIHP